MIELGELYRDRVSGFVGIATGRAEYLDESPMTRLTAQLGAGDDLKERWVPEGRVEPFEPQPPGFRGAP